MFWSTFTIIFRGFVLSKNVQRNQFKCTYLNSILLLTLRILSINLYQISTFYCAPTIITNFRVHDFFVINVDFGWCIKFSNYFPCIGTNGRDNKGKYFIDSFAMVIEIINIVFSFFFTAQIIEFYVETIVKM